MSPQERPPSQTDIVVAAITGMLRSGELNAGDRLPIEKDLAARLGVSRGSLREGIRALAVLGVVETRQGDGTYVTALDAWVLLSPIGLFAELQVDADASKLLFVRRVLETESAALAARMLSDEALAELGSVLDSIEDSVVGPHDDVDLEAFFSVDAEFHRRIARATGNEALAALIESLSSKTQRARTWRAMSASGAVAEAHLEHRAILDELRRRDPDRARVRMAAHLMAVEDFTSTHPTGAETAPNTLDQ